MEREEQGSEDDGLHALPLKDERAAYNNKTVRISMRRDDDMMRVRDLLLVFSTLLCFFSP